MNGTRIDTDSFSAVFVMYLFFAQENLKNWKEGK